MTNEFVNHLKCCPFCGSSNVRLIVSSDAFEKPYKFGLIKQYSVWCQNAGCRAGISGVYNREECLRIWNRREGSELTQKVGGLNMGDFKFSFKGKASINEIEEEFDWYVNYSESTECFGVDQRIIDLFRNMWERAKAKYDLDEAISRRQNYRVED